MTSMTPFPHWIAFSIEFKQSSRSAAIFQLSTKSVISAIIEDVLVLRSPITLTVTLPDVNIIPNGFNFSCLLAVSQLLAVCD